MTRLMGVVLLWAAVAAGFTGLSAAAISSGEIPPELARWRSWVLHGHEEALCPSDYNNGAVVRCQWPSRLKVEVTDDGGSFEQRWRMFSEGWVELPGSLRMWPDSVVVDGNSAAVVNRSNRPSIKLTPGEHHIKGRFYWQRRPEMINVPPSIGLITLLVDGQVFESPVMDDQGRLWLQEQTGREIREDHVKIRIFRLINDTIPMRVTTLLRLDVSGQPREIRLKAVSLQNLIPMELSSRLPARLDADGQLLVQVRPGRWEVSIIGRMPEPVVKMGPGLSMYGDEIWSFQPQHQLRMVEIQGAPQVEPGQTEMPDPWRTYSAFLMKPEAAMQFKEIRRGDPDPVPDQLQLIRQWWLDFDGGGFTLHDRIEGQLNRQWYLAVNAPVELGRVAIDGKDQVITEQGSDGKAGVELRKGALQLQSDARLPARSGPIEVVGWDHDFQKVSGELRLPPGWRLLAVTGVDQVSDTWLQHWSLLDFFLVLIITLAVFKLRDWRWGILALATMALIFHEPGAPRLVWLHILAVLALLPLLPDNWVKRIVGLWGFAAVGVLLIISIPFIVEQVRWGLYPQLSQHNDFGVEKLARFEMDQVAQQEKKAARKSERRMRTLTQLPGKLSKQAASPPMTADMAVQAGEGRAVWHQDPDALIPTGPGLPQWHWHTVRLGWNGPVDKSQAMRLFLLSPWMNLVLAVLRVGLLGSLIWGVVDWRPWWKKIQDHLHKSPAAMAAVLLLIGAYQVPAHAEGESAFPPTELLETLKERLLAPPDCLPYCADISRLEVAVSEDALRIMLKVNAADRTAVPLPVSRQSWNPEQILLDNAPISAMARDRKGGLWAVIPSGLHTVIMLGSVAGESVVQIPLPLKPHLASYEASGWAVKGILPDGSVGSSLQLTRIRQQQASRLSTRDNGRLPPFLNVRRTLYLGLTWQVRTIVTRVTPVGTPVVASVPLLVDESVTSAGMQVDDGQVLINMSPAQHQVSFASTLKIAPAIHLTAPRAVPWTETWVLDASPIWHCDLEGIPVVHHQDRGGQWQPQWQPWPGETVTIRVHRPKALEGQAVTIHNADLILSPGRRLSRGELMLKIHTSRGGQHTIELPPNTNLQEVRVNDKSLPVRQDGQWVTVPLQPGRQSVSVKWHQLVPFQSLLKGALVKIGQQAVNARVTIKMPQKRWILLTGGPQWGPAVLFWSYLAVIVLAALGLGRLPLTPLKTWQWVLLGIGLTQVPTVMALVIIGWLLALGLREQRSAVSHWLGFNLLQIGLILLTLVALAALFAAVKAGLIGQPDMQIDGNQSSSWTLNWTQDRIGGSLPRPWVLSLPLWCYRTLMLAWSLWLAYTLLGWLKWGWRAFAKDEIWKKKPPGKKKLTGAVTVQPKK